MDRQHPKAVRRRILEYLYHCYRRDPLDMPTPDHVMEGSAIDREDLVGSIHYLHDRGLVELMMGYAPPLFAATRLTAAGVDLVENQFEFDRQFPETLSETEDGTLPSIVERLAGEADFAPLNGDARRALRRDVHYIREELARPAETWRMHVITTVLDWIESWFDEPERHVPSAGILRALVLETQDLSDGGTNS